MRILGIDHGTKRIGLALSDELQMVANPLATLDAHPGVERDIALIVQQKRIVEVVIGMPYRMDGGHGSAAERVEKFATKLRKALPDNVPLVYVDERLSSRHARESLGLHRNALIEDMEQRRLVDQVAAVAILQDHLNSKQGPEAWLLPEEE
jgi:putative holliday junction resolvase